MAVSIGDKKRVIQDSKLLANISVLVAKQQRHTTKYTFCFNAYKTWVFIGRVRVYMTQLSTMFIWQQEWDIDYKLWFSFFRPLSFWYFWKFGADYVKVTPLLSFFFRRQQFNKSSACKTRKY